MTTNFIYSDKSTPEVLDEYQAALDSEPLTNKHLDHINNALDKLYLDSSNSYLMDCIDDCNKSINDIKRKMHGGTL